MKTIDHRDHDQREHAKPSTGSDLDFTPDPDTTDTIRAALCRLRYEREQQSGRRPEGQGSGTANSSGECARP